MSDRDLMPFGVAIGHATDEQGGTGLTVIRGVDGPLRCGVAVFGHATGSREFLTASPDHLVDGRVDAVLLTGGSAFGLDAAAGVMRWMEERGRGFPVGGGVVPIVPAAVIFDLAPLGRFDARPSAGMAYAACASAARRDVAEGSVGAGTGATVGKAAGPAHAMKGGFGLAVHGKGDAAVLACAVVNALGDVRDGSERIIAGARGERAGQFLDSVQLFDNRKNGHGIADTASKNTTLAAVVTRAALNSAQCGRLASAAGAALFRRITPAATAFDGDVVFAISPIEGPTADPAAIEPAAIAALEDAIERAVRLARGRDGIPGLADHAP